MITSASENFAIECCVIVFPVPKPPGIAAVPPRAIGKTVSRIRCPVINGSEAGSRFATGRGRRIGHFCESVSVRSFPEGSVTTTSGSFTV